MAAPRPQHLIATILGQVFEMGEVRLVPGMPREIAQTMTGWEPIDGWSNSHSIADGGGG
jgi:hypothetical protein